jgi:tetratricopeptide (TPR) repeat protein
VSVRFAVGPYVRRRMPGLLLVTAGLLAIVPAGANAATFEELSEGAAAARRNNNIPEAIKLYQQAVELRASWTEGWWFLGTLSYATYQYTGCETAFDQFVKLDERRPLAWSLLGLCEFETGRYDPALEHLARGLAGELAPEVEAGVRFHYGLLLTRAGLFDQAKRQLDRYAQAGGQEPLLVEGLGLNALRVPLLPKDISADRRHAIVQAGTVARFCILGQTGEAEAGFHKLIRDHPTVAGVHYLYGTYLASAHAPEAMAEFRRELELNPADPDASAMLALVLLHAHDTPDALPYAKKAATERPSDALAEYAYGEVLTGAGDLRPAIARLEAAVQLDPAMLAYHMGLAGAYSRAGRYQDARRERRLSIQMSAGVQAPRPPVN